MRSLENLRRFSLLAVFIVIALMFSSCPNSISSAYAASDGQSATHKRLSSAQKKKAHAAHLKQLAAKKAHEKQLAAKKAKKLTSSQKAHLKRLASKKAHEKKLAAKKAKKLTSSQKAHLKRVAQKEAREKRLAARKAKKLTSSQKAHLRRLAAKEKREQKIHNKKYAALLAKQEKTQLARQRAKKRETKLAAIAAQKAEVAAHKAQLAINAKHHAQRVRQAASAHKAAIAAHAAAIAAHQAAIAQQNAARRDRLARIQFAAANGVVQWGTYAESVPVQVIMVDLNKPNVKVTALLSRNGIGSSESFSHMIERSHAAVAVTGTFFSLDNLRPVGDIVIDGNLAYFGGMGTALAITPHNHADMITLPWGHHHNWSGYDCVVACGPRLLKDGSIWLNPRAERFHDPNMLCPNSRIAVGITPGNKLIFAMTRDRIYLGKLAKVMQKLGCNQAMNLDAGTSTGFYCNGSILAHPGRKLTNLIIVRTDGRRETSNDQSASEASSKNQGG